MQTLLKKINKFNIKLDYVDEKLDIQAPKGTMTKELLDEIKLHKNELIEFITLHRKAEKQIFIPKTSQKEGYVLSSSQRRLWLLSQLDGGNTAYNMPSIFKVNGKLDKESLQAAFKAVIERHESLRTIFKETESGEVQQIIVHPEATNFLLQYQDLSNQTISKETIEELIQKEIDYSFDLSSDSLVRAKLIKRAPESYVFICLIHHIVSDGWSSGILTTELFTIYDAFVNQKSNPLPPLELQYKDYAAWQQEQLKKDTIEIHKTYWLQKFQDEVPVLEIPAQHLRPTIKTYNGKSIKRFYDQQILKDFDALCKSQDSTLFMGLLSAVKILFYKYTHQTDIVIGSPIAGREQIELQNQIGFYVNTLALRTQFAKTDSFKEVLKNVKQVTLGAYEHQVFPFDDLVEALPLNRDISRNPLFDVMVRIQENAAKSYNQELSGITILEYEPEEDNSSKFDLEFAFKETDGKLGLYLFFNTDIYSTKFIEEVSSHLEVVLKSIVENPDTAIASLAYLTETEEHQILSGFNDTAVSINKEASIITLFEEQVQKNPNHIAVQFEETALTYQELNEKANQFAAYLIANYAIEADDFVGVKLEKSEKLIITIVGILKSGAAYVPIDPHYPQNRIDFIEQDSNCKVVVDNPELEKFENVQEKYPVDNINVHIKNNSLVYLIYTSGSTGQPKGIMMEHICMLNLILFHNEEFKDENVQKVLQFTSISFDVSFQEIFSTLLCGATLYPINEAAKKDSEELSFFIKNNSIDTIFLPTSYFKILMNFSSFYSLLESNDIKNIIVAGEQLTLNEDALEKIKNSKTNLHNHYGPAETHVVTILTLKDKHLIANPSIGSAIANTQLYILDDAMQPVAIGVTGKLYIGGLGVARGYLNRAELTTEKFIPNPFTAGSRLYDTGDLGTWLPDGNIEFKGRKDHQVKIRGFRVELGEVENAILQYSEDLKQVIVEAKEIDQVKVLVAYFVSVTVIDKSDLKIFLQDKLPDYMLPAFFIALETMSLTSNGKIDRKALPEIQAQDLIKREYVAPENATQASFALIWQEVLGIDRIGITDNFFDLGGHSLIVGQIINRIYKQLNKTVNFKTFFANPTIAALSKVVHESSFVAIPKAVEASSYPVTASQGRLWVLSQLEGGSLAYNMPAVIVLKGIVDVDKFRESFQLLISRYEILRTYFKTSDQGEIRQYIVPANQVNFDITLKDYSQTSNQEEVVARYLKEINSEPFHLEKAPLIRASLLHLKTAEQVFFLSMHHIIGDGWSIELLMSEVIKVYNSLLQGQKIVLPELSLQYKDYAVWLNEELQQEKNTLSEEYWLKQFSGELPILNLPSSKTRPLVQTYAGDSLSYRFSGSFLEQLKAFSKSHDVTLFMTLMSGINALLYRYTGNDDIIIGTPVAGREHPDLENQLGLYLNTLAIRSKIAEQNSFLDLVAVLKENLLGAYEHQNYPFDLLVGKLNLKRDTSRSALFDVLVILQNQGQLNNINNEELLSLQVSDYEFKTKTSKFDLSFTFAEDEELILTIEYNTDVYDAHLIERMFAHLENLLTNCIVQPETDILKVAYLTQQEKDQVLTQFNATAVAYPKESTVLNLFETQAQKAPDSIAVSDDQFSYTYRELDELSNQIAAYLSTELGENDKSSIAVMLTRSSKLIAVLLGILKSGRSYIPLDPKFPVDRLAWIISNSEAKLLVTENSIEVDFEEGKIDNIIYTEELFSKLPDTKSKNQLKVSQDDTAYIIYTSGSTGNPKGVEIGHGALVNFLLSMADKPGIKKDDILFSVTTYSFDISILEFFLPLITGAKLYVASHETLIDSGLIIDRISAVKPTILQATPSFYQMLLDTGWKGSKELKVLCGGDLLSEALAEKLIDHTLEVWNMYGPTETTIWSSVKKTEHPKEASNIGKPINNTQFYILDQFLNPKPVATAGSLYIAGDGLAKGYYKNEVLSKEKFIKNPFKENSLIYETGDVGKWNEKGEIEFLGRNDNQVKIRGFRIELGDIETAILQYSNDLKQIVVAVKENGGQKFLVAYYTTTAEIEKTDLRDFLKEKLPEYMIPGFYVSLEVLPLTSNGKIDRKALPEVVQDDIIKTVYVAPGNDTEQKLVSIWQDVLGIDKIGVTDNFFELGGNSLVIVQVINQVFKELGKKILFKDFFSDPTIERLCKKFIASDYTAIPNVPVSGSYPVSSTQKQLWVLSQFDGGSLAYNIPLALKISGNLDIDKLEKSFDRLIERYEILRTYFKLSDSGNIEQFIVDKKEIDYKIDIVDFSSKKMERTEISDYLNNINAQPFDLQNAPLLKNVLIKTNEKEFVFFFSIHHIIGDGQSLEIIIREILKVYNQLNKEGIEEVRDLKIQYKDFVSWKNKETENYIKSEQYWLEEFKGELPTLDIPTFKKRPLIKSYNGNKKSYQFSNEFLNDTLLFAKNNDVTLFMTLLSGFNLFLYTYSNQQDIILGTPFSGRSHPDLENQIGLFINIFPIRTKINVEGTFKDLLTDQKANILNSIEHQNYPLNDLIEKLNINRDTSRSALFDVMMSLNTEIQSIDYTEFKEFKIEDFKFNKQSSQFDLNFVFHKYEAFGLDIEYNTDVFEEFEIDRMFKDFQNIMNKAFHNPDLNIKGFTEKDKAIKNRNINKLSNFSKKQL